MHLLYQETGGEVNYLHGIIQSQPRSDGSAVTDKLLRGSGDEKLTDKRPHCNWYPD